MKKSAVKSGKPKLPDGRVAAGKGPAPGAPNAGRPTIELAQMCREIGLKYVIPRIITYLGSSSPPDPDSQGFRWASDVMLDRGWGKALQQVSLGNSTENPLLPSDALARVMGGLTRLAAAQGMGQASSAA